MKEILFDLKNTLSLLEPYKEEAIKASSAYWKIQKLIPEVEKLVFAFPSGNGPGMTAKQYAAIQLKVPRSGDADIDAMIRESRRAEFAKEIGSNIAADSFWENEDNYKKIANISCKIADAMLAELEVEE